MDIIFILSNSFHTHVNSLSFNVPPRTMANNVIRCLKKGEKDELNATFPRKFRIVLNTKKLTCIFRGVIGSMCFPAFSVNTEYMYYSPFVSAFVTKADHLFNFLENLKYCLIYKVYLDLVHITENRKLSCGSEYNQYLLGSIFATSEDKISYTYSYNRKYVRSYFLTISL